MTETTRVGADLAKNVIQIHAVDALGKVVTNRPLARDKFMAWCAQLPAGCLIAMEARSSAHHWARKLVLLGLDARVIAAHLGKNHGVRSFNIIFSRRAAYVIRPSSASLGSSLESGLAIKKMHYCET